VPGAVFSKNAMANMMAAMMASMGAPSQVLCQVTTGSARVRHVLGFGAGHLIFGFTPM
jgi:hypothetical protein